MKRVLLPALLAVSAEAQQNPSPASAVPAVSQAPAPAPNTVLRVREKGDGKNLSKVEVEILGAGTKVLTDPNGATSLDIPAAGDGKLRFTRSGYEPLEVPFSELRPPGEFDVFLWPKAPDDDNVIVITGKRRPQVSRKSVSVDESRRIAPSGDPAQVVKLLPGVQTRSGGFGNQVIVRGSGPRDSRYYIDDLEVPFIFHGIGNLSVVPAPLMSEVEFDAGGFGPEHGNATGGVVTIRTKTEIPERPKTEFVVNVPFYSGVYHERPLSEDSMMAVSARRSYIDVFIKQALKRTDEGGGITLVPYFGDAQAAYVKKSESGHTKLSVLGAYDGIKAAVPADSFADEEGRAKIEFQTAFVNLGVERMTRLDKDWKYTSTPQVYYYETNADFVGNQLNIQQTSVRMPTELTRRLSKTEDFVVGVDPAYQTAKIDFDAIDFKPGDPTFDPEEANRRRIVKRIPFQQYAAWTSIDQQLGDTLVTPGVRGFYNSQLKKTSADPRLRARHQLTELHAIKSAVGQYSQAPEPAQASAEFGNPHLDYTRSIHYVLGLETKWSDAWTSEIQGFYKTASDVVTSDVDKRYDNDGSFRSRGAEIFIRRNLTARLFGWLSYTYSRTEERDTDRESFHESRYDQTHVVNLVGSYKLTSTWEAGGRYNHHTGDTYTPITDSVYNAALDKYQDRDTPGSDSGARLPAYNALTAYLTKDFLFDTWKLAWKFGLESYWPRPQVLGVGYNYDYSKEEERRGLTAIPFIELRGEM